MPRQNRVAEGLIPGSCKIRKRGCSSSSSTSSVLQNYRVKRAILAGKARGSRSGTPVPTWRTAAVLEEEEEHAPSQSGGRSRPVSARKLAATLWEMNEVPSPRMRERVDEKRSVKREMRVRERVGHRSVHSPSLPPHLSDPSHSPVSERMDRSGTGSRHRRTSSISHRLRLADHNVDVLDSLSSASLMEIETRSRVQTPSGSVVGGGRTRLKDVSNALMTSKELLKIINRIWAHDDQPSSSLSLISALHAELERARLQVNQLIQEQRSDQNEISCLIKCFTEEKAAWKKKEKEVVEAAIESVAGELEVERKLRRRLESLNKKLGKELAETKASLVKAVKELESEKRAREVIEQVCDDLARDVGEDKADVEEMNRESVKIREEVENEREMLHIADKLREERAQMKLSEARHQFEEKNSFVDKLRNQLEGFMRTKRGKQKGSRSPSYGNTDDITAYLSRTRFGSHQNDIKEEDGELEDGADCEEDSTESDIPSIELNMDYNNKSYKLKNSSGKARDSREVSVDDDIKGRIFTTGKASRRSTSLQRSISDEIESGLDRERIYEGEKQAQRRSYGDDMKDYKSVKTLRDQVLSGLRLGSEREFASPTRQWGQAWPSRDPYDTVKEKPTILQGSGLNSRLAEPRGEGQAARRSKR
ncbi:uncharacterized protein At5g41620-like [Actinidia eriantha]|uniref:uncharacterized protein At5g41620-like n=1 Tax=Actinidia eriantha TaxID=165200 RepID=UPI00258EC898|nr:uncharacterized protein At5g41620-like [Actinidia eriantha]